jgi:hypothetical protein
MFTKPVRRTILLALALTLCVLPAAAQAGVLQLSRGEDRFVASRFQDGEGIFRSLWKRLVGIWEKNGASIDPSGGSGGGTTNSGASIDPTGTPTPAPSGSGG